MDVDDTDARLLDALFEDGRASARALAETTDVAAATVSRRLDELEEGGVLSGYEPRIDYAGLGYTLTVVLRLSVAGGALAEVVEELRARDRMMSVYEVTGDHDVVVVGKFTSTDELHDRVGELLTREAVDSVDVAIVRDVACEFEQFAPDRD
jgi:DNA-binding Lrp family transcriptional regulator